MNANISTLQILALNDAEQSENRIHSDEVAARYGFKGALVSGVNVFGYLSQPLVRIYGEQWLQQGMLDVLFMKPAYQDDLLTISTENLDDTSDQRSHLTSAHNEQGQLLARLESWLPTSMPKLNHLAHSAGGKANKEREEISWDRIELGSPAPLFSWQPSIEENQAHVQIQRDQSPLYQGEAQYIHPYFLLDACNKSLMRMFILPAWVHTGSKLVLREGIRVGDTLQVLTVPIDKWERKGHQFIKLYIAMKKDNDVALEVEHTSIFRLAAA